MPHEDQFTAKGPPIAGSGFARAGFSTKTSVGMVHGLNVQGTLCGVYGESVLGGSGSRSPDVDGVGVYGFGESFGLFGNGNRGIAGVYGQNNRGRIGAVGAVMRGGTGVVGASLKGLGNPLDTWQTTPSVSGGGSGTGVLGISGTGDGTRGESESGIGVSGNSRSGPGVSGTTGGVFSPGPGVLGQSVGGTGVRGISTSTEFLAPPGVAGVSDDGSGVDGRSDTWFGVLGLSKNGSGVIGMCGSDNGAGVIGSSIPEQSCGRAGLFNGPVDVFGNFTVANGTKNFQIDHPLDPQNKYLLHNAVESSEMKNVYDGVARLDEDGAAWVDLPQWFEALNGNFRYQLTAVGEAAPNLHVAEEISENRFKIAGGEGGMKVCWQVTGSRKDPWAAANPFEVEQEKPQKDRGRYLQPDLYDAPEEQRVMIGPEEEKLRQMMRQEPPEAT